MIINKEIEASLARNFDGPFRFLLAVSGGPDSQVLISAFSHVAERHGHIVSALGVNHGLRPEADSELDLAQALCEKVGIPFFRERIQVEPGGNLQARARDERYSVLFKKAYELKANLVTAHHLDDRAETVLIRLMRASTVKCLGVLPEMQHIKYQDTHFGLYRPLLNVSREDIIGYAERWKLNYATDPSNSNDHYMRVWVRNTLLPMMKEKSPDIVNKLNKIAEETLHL